MASNALAHGTLAHLLPLTYKQTITAWLSEDCPSFDYGGFVVGEDPKTATLYGKAPVRPLPNSTKGTRSPQNN